MNAVVVKQRLWPNCAIKTETGLLLSQFELRGI